MKKFEFTLITDGGVASCPPNPDFLTGMSVDAGYRQMCIADMPYPAASVGVMRVDCSECGAKVGFTVAGRIDDPRRVTLPCKVRGNRPIRAPRRLPYGSE